MTPSPSADPDEGDDVAPRAAVPAARADRATRREALLAEREQALALRARLVPRRTRLARVRESLRRQALRR